jgi:hypothetical protein
MAEAVRPLADRACDVCGTSPCLRPGFCAECRKADARRRSVRIDLLPEGWDVISFGALCDQLARRLRGTPQSTVDALMCALRARGLPALKAPAGIERLLRCDTVARSEINKRIAKLVAAKKIAT